MKLAPTRALQLLAATAIAIATLSGCSTIKGLLPGKTDKIGTPAKRENITPTLTVHQIWAANVCKC